MNQLPSFGFAPPAALEGRLKITAVLSLGLLFLGTSQDPQRGWGNILEIGFCLVSLGLAGTFFVALQYATGASWSVAFRRIPEAMSAVVPFGAAVLAVVFLGRPSIYPWTADASHHIAGFKALWLNWPFFLFRAAAYVALWMLFARTIVRTSRLQDGDGDLAHTRRNIRLSVAFVILFALSFWLASVDWIMSLEPEWASTIFGVYNFAGMFSAGLAVVILLAAWLRQHGPLGDFINVEHLHDLGKLLFAFTTFWMYIWFSQYMLIWYANITEESVYYVLRQRGLLAPLFVLNVVLNWGLPFLALLSKFSKRNPAALAKIAVIVLLGRWLDLYLMILPPVTQGRVAAPWQEVAALAATASIFLLVFLRAVRQAPPVPVRDPYLIESLHYHN